MKKYIIANWKALPESWAEAESILDFLSEHLAEIPDEASMVVCPPFVYLEEVSKILQASGLAGRVVLGAQDLAVGDEPGQTGEVTGAQLANLGVRYVIIGHSERRWKIGEPDHVVNQKLELALEHGLTPIVCIGEKVHDEHFEQFLKDQVATTFAGLSADDIAKCLITYEPVWAISTNPDAKPDSPDETRKALAIIQPLVPNSALLYGGSVNKSNAHEFLSMPETTGVLVGGASVRKEEFLEILKAVVQ